MEYENVYSCCCTLTIIAKFLLIHHSASTLVRDVRYPDAANPDILRLELLVQLIPQGLVKFLQAVSRSSVLTRIH